MLMLMLMSTSYPVRQSAKMGNYQFWF
jgi:hypothetical protein